MILTGKEFLHVGKNDKGIALFCPWKYIGCEIWSLAHSLRSDLHKTFFSFPSEFQFLAFLLPVSSSF